MPLFSKVATAKTPKRHCMVVHAYYPVGETRVEREALALVQHGYEVDVLCLRNENEAKEENIDGVNVYRLPVRRRRGRGSTYQLLEYLAFFFLALGKLFVLQNRRHYGVVQVHNLPDFLVFAASWPKLVGARVILDLHDLMPEFYAARFGKPLDGWQVRLTAWQEKLACGFADRVITVTDLWQNTLAERGVPREKITVILNVARDDLFFRGENGPKHLRSSDQFHLIYHGTITQRYGVDLILRAVEIVKDDITGIQLTILGEGDYREDIEEMVDTLDLGGYVSFSQGFLPTAELPDLIRQADVGVVPNRNDVFTGTLLPTKLLEYIALGLPVIASRTPALATYFDDSMIEFFTPGDVEDLAERIRTLYRDETRRKALTENSAQFNQHYSWPQISQKFVNLVDSLNDGRQTICYRNGSNPSICA